MSNAMLKSIYSHTTDTLSDTGWHTLLDSHAGTIAPDALPRLLQETSLPVPIFLSDLAAIEYAVFEVTQAPAPQPKISATFSLNPTLTVIQAKHRVDAFFHGPPGKRQWPHEENCWIMVWKSLHGHVHVHAAGDDDLLALKMVTDNLDLPTLSQQGPLSEGRLKAVRWKAVRRDLILAPPSTIYRQPGQAAFSPSAEDDDQRARVFTLQWHITNACDLHCKHCYDRSRRDHQSLAQAQDLLGQLEAFTGDRNVEGHVCFTGGNPFLHPHFQTLYQAAADHGFSTSILGNPVNYEALKAIRNIQRPEYYQISLEGLAPHSDAIRGEGHYRRSLEFLGDLRSLGIRSTVMMTLTRDNIDQVIPLAQQLRGCADLFTFNRLSPVGEGANLQLPEPADYQAFLENYVHAAPRLSILGYKDNLINRWLHAKDRPLFGGCTGFGCGAAFSFVAVLPDGEVHACRKFPSLIGHLNTAPLAEIYESDAAARYRRGSAGCANCTLRHLCGGCMAVTSGLGGNPFVDRDPFCGSPV